ncbi:hypothetical protein BROUX41_004705 [Berkeleyomyces rouxiae]
MSSERLLGDILCPNRKKGQEFPVEARVAMLALSQEGVSARAIAKKFRTDHKTVTRILLNAKENSTLKPKPRSGRPQKLSPAQKRYIMRLMKKDPAITLASLVKCLDGTVCLRTIQRFLASNAKQT